MCSRAASSVDASIVSPVYALLAELGAADGLAVDHVMDARIAQIGRMMPCSTPREFLGRGRVETAEVIVQRCPVGWRDVRVDDAVQAPGVGLDVLCEETVPGVIIDAGTARWVVPCPERVDQRGLGNREPLQPDETAKQESERRDEQPVRTHTSCHAHPPMSIHTGLSRAFPLCELLKEKF
jgi:hypothetical protein